MGAGRPRIDASSPCVTQGLSMTVAAWELLERICVATGKTQREVVTEALFSYGVKYGVPKKATHKTRRSESKVEKS